jgi:predicted DNA-binding transcriptional regulator AlpA
MDETRDQPEEHSDRLLDDWLSRADLAKELGVSVDTLSRWETSRTGPICIRLGRRVFYRKNAVREWLRGRETKRPGGDG